MVWKRFVYMLMLFKYYVYIESMSIYEYIFLYIYEWYWILSRWAESYLLYSYWLCLSFSNFIYMLLTFKYIICVYVPMILNALLLSWSSLTLSDLIWLFSLSRMSHVYVLSTSIYTCMYVQMILNAVPLS